NKSLRYNELWLSYRCRSGARPGRKRLAATAPPNPPAGVRPALALDTRYEKLNWAYVLQRAGFWAVFTTLLVYAVWPLLPGVGEDARRTLVVYGFSILGEVINEAVFPAFQAEWEARTG